MLFPFRRFVLRLLIKDRIEKQAFKIPDLPLKNMGSNRRPAVSVSVSQELHDEWVEEAEVRGMNLSEYIRCMVAAGRRQVANLEPSSGESQNASMRQAVLKELPREKESAAPAEEIIEDVLAPIREDIYDVLDEDDEIQSSARHGGYYRE